MGFMGRGNRPSVGNNIGNLGNRIGLFRRPYLRIIRYVPLDNTYVIMQMIATFIILVVGTITFLTVYKSDIIDPIENTKKLFINSHLITIGILLAITVIINAVSKKETDLLKRLVLTAIISVTAMLVFGGIKLNLDTTYTKTRFEQFYIEQNSTEENSGKTKIDIEISGVKIKTEEEYYIDECIKLYNIFKIKSWGSLGLHFLLNGLLIYQISKVHKIQNKKEKLNKDEAILFDEEQNVKF